MKYEVLFEKYVRCGCGGLKRINFEANNDVEALLRVHKNSGYGYYDNEGREFGDEGFEMPDLTKLIEKLEEENGDGMDFVFKIENVDESKILFECDYEEAFC